MARVLIDQAACVSCGRCVEICPVDVFRSRAEDQRAYVAYPDDCSGCHFCAQECPVACIAIDDRRNADGVSLYDKLGIEDRWGR